MRILKLIETPNTKSLEERKKHLKKALNTANKINKNSKNKS
ncbi:hypothetical protein SAMN04487776_1753 [Priestia megaterium]|nr:hypothetical protein SAMN04487776_1753 [Priestia megaterium]